MVREGAGRKGAAEVVLRQAGLRASPLQLGLVFWAALRKIYGAGWLCLCCSTRNGC